MNELFQPLDLYLQSDFVKTKNQAAKSHATRMLVENRTRLFRVRSEKYIAFRNFADKIHTTRGFHLLQYESTTQARKDRLWAIVSDLPWSEQRDCDYGKAFDIYAFLAEYAEPGQLIMIEQIMMDFPTTICVYVEYVKIPTAPAEDLLVTGQFEASPDHKGFPLNWNHEVHGGAPVNRETIGSDFEIDILRDIAHQWYVHRWTANHTGQPPRLGKSRFQRLLEKLIPKDKFRTDGD